MIEISHLKKIYGGKIIFDEYEFSVGDNEYVAIIGKSGQGKSTLLNIVGLLDDEYEGEYILNGENVKKLSEKKKSRLRNKLMGFVFQNYNLIDELSVIENIYMPYCYSKNKFDSKQKLYIEEIVKKLDIFEISRQKVKHLSGGEKQRVSIARALALNPPIILADEPTGNLDVENTRIVMDFFEEMRMKGKSVVLVTHNLNIIDKCDTVIDLSGGELLC